MKNIVFIISDLGMGGAQRVITLLVDKLAALPGHHIDIITMAPQQDKSFYPWPPAVTLHYADINSASGGLVDAVGANIRRIKTLRHMLKNLKADLVISFQTETNCTVLLSTLGTGIPVIVSERSDPYVYPASRIWRLIRRLVYPLASGAVFQTAYAAGFFGNLIRHKAVIFNPVHVTQDESIIPVSGPYILGVGRFSAEKGFDDLIRAHALAHAKAPDLKLVLVGDGPEKENLMALAAQSGAGENVVFAGAQTNLSGYYKNALAFVLPSRFEGLPNALIEAMAYGCPVIATPLFKAGPEIIAHGENGLIAAEATPQGFVDQIIDIYNDSTLRTRLGHQGKADSARFSGDTIAAAWMVFMQSFLK